MDALDFFRMIDEEKKQQQEKKLAEEVVPYDTASWSESQVRKFPPPRTRRKKGLKKLRREKNS